MKNGKILISSWKKLKQFFAYMSFLGLFFNFRLSSVAVCKNLHCSYSLLHKIKKAEIFELLPHLLLRILKYGNLWLPLIHGKMRVLFRNKITHLEF
jgi:hypothetical protein